MSEEIRLIANDWWMYLLGIIVTIFVLGSSIFYVLRSYKEAKELNMDKKTLDKVVVNSIAFSALPSVSIFIGVIALSGFVGNVVPWIRLSVIGALQYEGFAINQTLTAFGVTAVTTSEQLVTIVFVMTLGILLGPLFCLFGFKIYDKKVLSKAKENPTEEAIVVDENKTEETKEAKPKKNFGDMIFNAVFIAMICAFLVDDIKLLFKKPEVDTDAIVNTDLYVPTFFVPTVVIIITFLSMYLFDVLEKKFKLKWLGSFSLGLSMIIGMASAALLEWLVK